MADIVLRSIIRSSGDSSTSEKYSLYGHLIIKQKTSVTANYQLRSILQDFIGCRILYRKDHIQYQWHGSDVEQY